MKAAFESLSLKWLASRMPPEPSHRLSHGNIFIFPGVFGVFYLVMTLCLFLLAINYQNNLLLFLSQFLISLILIALFSAYKNVAGMLLTAYEVKPVFAGENSYLEIRIEENDKPLHGQIEIKWYGDKNRHMLDLEMEKKLHHLPFPTASRGFHRLPRVTVTCSWPLGLIKCWTHLDFGHKLLVYPAQKAEQILLAEWHSENGKGRKNQSGTDDFYALYPWQAGESLSRVAWKRVAKGDDWLNKVFTEQQATSGYLDIDSVSNLDTETALSVLCWQIVQLSAAGSEYGLKLGNVIIPPSVGPAHRSTCLKALALYQRGDAL
ncbi:DUF58 domain-containing protein [Alteromonas confluentis]|uniref:Uncharacterized protein n=1 Tax=Alteromonas confluentis TaxID=1656094 RepID=A0A1E7ZFN2_9ALTE|nr:DUF58 domain-containing protein [Alteromonas confluentis]OFC72321.1 hypothetical protein BFC18_03435 [Alteromonas confluentis]